MKHKHLFKKVFDEDIRVNDKQIMEGIFGKLPPLPKGKKWGRTNQHRTIFRCSCKKEMTFMDIEGGDYNKGLGEEFTTK